MAISGSRFRRALPLFLPVRQNLSQQRVSDPTQDARRQLLDAGLAQKIQAGDEVAITAGSRGAGNAAEALTGIASAIQECGGKPFIIPAMGSHAGASASGQRDLLEKLGITEATTGAPIRSVMQTVELGRASNGAVAHLDAKAARAAGTIVLARVQIHQVPRKDWRPGF